MTRHHIWYPASIYKTQLEQDFRSLCCHIVEMDEKTHFLTHAFAPPPQKPWRSVMLRVVINHLQVCRSCKVRFGRRKYMEAEVA